MTPPIDDHLLAADLVRSAGRLAWQLRTDGLSVDQKTSVSDVVTAADHAAEELVVGRLREARPHDAIVGEEGTDHPGTSGRSWVIDPVDGTWNFVQGLSHWCSALALEATPGVVLGAVHHPHDDHTWVGGPDLPTSRDGVPLEWPADAALAEVGVGTYLHPTWFTDPAVADPWRRAARGAATIRMLGSGSMDLVAVAEGRLGCWFQHSVPAWDWLPGQALVLGTGGAAEQIEVDGFVWSVAGRPSAVAEVIVLLRES
ncbi:inositol monophosphatase family protein [Nocardioides sp.]|uniref:inositol monophosphatase family protein n=1 Tax=Nocardioides sp. TaxID=35761 RepID=UPI0027347EB9|nr:inositol monophosphatase family protein [Nocardioides sp.]MDP3889713.1 inositol monophosphatase family protein [Nocardioides sp.]